MSLLRIFVASAVILSGVSLPAQDLQAECQAIAKETGLALTFSESENFVWLTSLSAGQVKPTIAVVEEAFALFKKVSGVKDWKEMWGERKCLFVITRSKLDHKTFVNWYGKKYKPYQGFESVASQHKYFPQPFPWPACLLHLKPATPVTIRHNAVHVLGHLCMMRYAYHNNFIPPWLEEGFGVWLEANALGKTTCYCFGGASGDTETTETDFTLIEWRKWKQAVLGDAAKKRHRPFVEVMPLRMNQFNYRDAGQLWSVIDYLMAEDPAKFFLFIRKMKANWPKSFEPQYTPEKFEAQEKALSEVYGIKFAELDERWRNHVRKSYR